MEGLELSYNITLIPGDGIGPEISDAMLRCVEATGVNINWDKQDAGADQIDKYGTPLPDAVIESIKKNKIAIKGPIVTPIGTGFRSVNVALRKKLDLYACVRPCKLYKGVRSRYENVDLVIFRENTEDLYAGIEFEQGSKEALEIINKVDELAGSSIKKDSGITIKPISISGTQRIVRAAFEYAVKNNRKSVTAVHKANIMKDTDGLFLHTFREIAKEYEGKVEYWDLIVDNCSMQLVQRPENLDVLVMPNLYGDILSDLCAGLIGGLGMAPGANIGNEIALFEPTHGSAPKYAGTNKINPCALILSAVLMLRHIGETAAADKLENAIAEVIGEGTNVTYDFKDDRNDPSSVGTQEMADAIIAKMK